MESPSEIVADVALLFHSHGLEMGMGLEMRWDRNADASNNHGFVLSQS